MSKIFIIAGLGADPRIFGRLDLGGHEVIHVDWIVPNKTDTLRIYAQRIIDQYNITENSIIAGNSMGGMIGIEIGNIIKLQKLILISSIKTIDEAPLYFKFFRNMPVYNAIPEKALTSMEYLMELSFGQMEKDDIPLFRDMLRNWGAEFLRWAMGAIVNWDNKIIPPNTFHIIGDKDLVFPYSKIKNAIIVRGGTHIMIYDRAAEINRILKGIFDNETAPVVLS